MGNVAAVRVPLLLVCVLTLGLVISPGSVQAQEEGGGAEEAPMESVSCDHLSPEYREDAQANGYCIEPSSKDEVAEPDGYAPNGYAIGPCGTTTFALSNRGGGFARFYMAASSSQGTISRLRFDVHWTNHTWGRSESFGGGAWPWSSTWAESQVRSTGQGYVSGYMTGYAVAGWTGTICTFLNPYSETNVTM